VRLWSSLSGLALPQLSTLYCNIARWPLAGRLLVGAVLALLVLLAGDAVYLGGAREVLQRQEAGEVALRQQFAAKARQAAQYDGVARELETLRIAFNEQLRQMPTLTQMPGLQANDVLYVDNDNRRAGEEATRQLVDQFNLRAPRFVRTVADWRYE